MMLKRKLFPKIIALVIILSFFSALVQLATTNITKITTLNGYFTNSSNINHSNIHSEPTTSGNGDNYSVILMIGDGMGFEHINLAREVEFGSNGTLAMETLPYHFQATTQNIFGLTTDSAAAATAIATGEKTANSMISMSLSNAKLQTILEIAQDLNKSTGLVSTTSIQHATPACFATHVGSRNNYGEISRQFVEEATVDILLGGGSKYFTTSQLQQMELGGYSIVTNRTTLTASNATNLLGIFAEGHLPYETERNYSIVPSLAEMTQNAIEILSQDPDGFFLMIEGGRIDHSSHSNDKISAALETIAFDYAVREAIAFVSNTSNAILLVTADHETGGLAVISNSASAALPQTANTEIEKRNLRIARTEEIAVSWSTGGHTQKEVPLLAYGKAFSSLKNNSRIDNTDIFHFMNDYYNNLTLTIHQSYSSPAIMSTAWLVPLFLVLLLANLLALVIFRKKLAISN